MRCVLFSMDYSDIADDNICARRTLPRFSLISCRPRPRPFDGRLSFVSGSGDNTSEHRRPRSLDGETTIRVCMTYGCFELFSPRRFQTTVVIFSSTHWIIDLFSSFLHHVESLTRKSLSNNKNRSPRVVYPHSLDFSTSRLLILTHVRWTANSLFLNISNIVFAFDSVKLVKLDYS
jgi:hypothetical protein